MTTIFMMQRTLQTDADVGIELRQATPVQPHAEAGGVHSLQEHDMLGNFAAVILNFYKSEPLNLHIYIYRHLRMAVHG